LAAAVDDTVGNPWQSEDIPSDDLLYMRIHKGWWSRKKQRFGIDAFRNSGEGAQAGMSTNWSKYASAEETRDQATSRPEENYVVAMRVSDVRAVAGLTVKHAPLPDDRAHADVIGEKTLEVKEALRQICKIVVEPSDDGAPP